jgi:hypothetical protein
MPRTCTALSVRKPTFIQQQLHFTRPAKTLAVGALFRFFFSHIEDVRQHAAPF